MGLRCDGLLLDLFPCGVLYVRKKGTFRVRNSSASVGHPTYFLVHSRASLDPGPSGSVSRAPKTFVTSATSCSELAVSGASTQRCTNKGRGSPAPSPPAPFRRRVEPGETNQASSYRKDRSDPSGSSGRVGVGLRFPALDLDRRLTRGTWVVHSPTLVSQIGE